MKDTVGCRCLEKMAGFKDVNGGSRGSRGREKMRWDKNE